MESRYLLDTHVIVDLGRPNGFEKMPTEVRLIFDDPSTELLLSTISDAELAIKNRIGKLALTKEDLALVCSQALITSYPLRCHHSARLFDLPLHHNDPFDRLIISTALSDDLPVISRDKQFRKYKGLRVIWR